MSKTTVHQFEVWDITNDQMHKLTRLGTPDAIKNIAILPTVGHRR